MTMRCNPWSILGWLIVGSASAQVPLLTTWQALAPLQVTFGSWPAGPLTSGSLSGGGGALWWGLDDSGAVHKLMLMAAGSSDGHGSFGHAFADTLLTVASPTSGFATIEVMLIEGGTTTSQGTSVDIGNDGTVEVPSQAGPASRERRSIVWDFANGPLPIRITSTITVSSSTWFAQTFLSVLQLEIRPWVAGAQPAAPSCAAAANTPFLFTDYAVTMEPAAPPYFAELRARGLGEYAAFLFSLQPTAQPLTLPSPFVGTCDVLTDVFATSLGTPADPVGSPPDAQPSLWTLAVPPLPPGLTFYIQHASASSMTNAYWFGATNRIRLDT